MDQHEAVVGEETGRQGVPLQRPVEEPDARAVGRNTCADPAQDPGCQRRGLSSERVVIEGFGVFMFGLAADTAG